MGEENPMMKRWREISGLLLLVPVMFLTGCIAGETYRSETSAPAYNRDIPRALSDTDPALRDWYTAPYFDPYEMP